MNFKPLGNRILLKALEKNKTINGIIVPDTVHEKPIYFEVLAVGEGFYNDRGDLIPIKNINVGDTILLPKHSGINIVDEETQETVRVANASEVLGIFYK